MLRSRSTAACAWPVGCWYALRTRPFDSSSGAVPFQRHVRTRCSDSCGPFQRRWSCESCGIDRMGSVAMDGSLGLDQQYTTGGSAIWIAASAGALHHHRTLFGPCRAVHSTPRSRAAGRGAPDRGHAASVRCAGSRATTQPTWGIGERRQGSLFTRLLRLLRGSLQGQQRSRR